MAKNKASSAPIEPIPVKLEPHRKSKLTSYRFSTDTDARLAALTSRLGMTRTALLEASVVVFAEALDRAEVDFDKIPRFQG